MEASPDTSSTTGACMWAKESSMVLAVPAEQQLSPCGLGVPHQQVKDLPCTALGCLAAAGQATCTLHAGIAVLAGLCSWAELHVSYRTFWQWQHMRHDTACGEGSLEGVHCSIGVLSAAQFLLGFTAFFYPKYSKGCARRAAALAPVPGAAPPSPLVWPPWRYAPLGIK